MLRAFSVLSCDKIRELRSCDAENIEMCKQLLFPEGISVSRDKKVHTPKISNIYRVATNKKDPERSLESFLAGDEGFEPPIMGPEPTALPLG